MDVLSVLPVGYAPDAPASAPASDIDRDAESSSEFDAMVGQAEDAAAPPRPRRRPEPKDWTETDAAPPAGHSSSKEDAPKAKAVESDSVKTSGDKPAASDASDAAAPATPSTADGDSAPIVPPMSGDAMLRAGALAPATNGLLAGAAPPTALQPAGPFIAPQQAPATIDAPPTLAVATPTAPAAPSQTPAVDAAAPDAAAAPTPAAPVSAQAAPAPVPPVAPDAPVAPVAPNGQPAVVPPTAAQAAAALATQAPDAAAQNPRADRDLAKTAKPSDGKNAARTTTADPAASAGKPAAHGADAAAVKTATTERPIVTTQEQALLGDAADAAGRAGGGQTIDAADAGGLRRTETAHAAPAADRAQAHRGPHIDLAALATRFAARVQNGATKFTIRLDPAELGRIDVRLEVSHDGVAQARLIAERPEALAELTRNARTLERELAEAGVDVSGGLSFELAGRGEGGEAQERDHGPAAAHPVFASAQAAEPLAQAADALAEIDTAYGFSVLRRGRLDVRI